jgi:TPR repeat protein
VSSGGVFAADVSGAVSMLQEGVTWLRRAVEAGVIDSSYDLAVLYEQVKNALTQRTCQEELEHGQAFRVTSTN